MTLSEAARAEAIYRRYGGFCGSDEILTRPKRETREGSIMVPVTVGMIAIAYNVPA
jgi:hypothetical protein